MSDSRGHLPGDRWEFDEGVTECFDDMLNRSIPLYEEMRNLVTRIALSFLPQTGVCVDVGASRGGAIAVLADARPYGRFIGLETSESMLSAARERFSAHPNVWIRRHDLRVDPYPDVVADVTLVVLTLQFVPIEYRWSILRDIYASTRPGGAVIVVEKVLGSSYPTDRLFTDVYLEKKANSGYTDEEITRKRHSLEGVLVPITAEWNQQMIEKAGFHAVDCFFRWMNFAGWLGTRP